MSDEEMAAINIVRDEFHGEWNYTIDQSNNLIERLFPDKPLDGSRMATHVATTRRCPPGSKTPGVEWFNFSCMLALGHGRGQRSFRSPLVLRKSVPRNLLFERDGGPRVAQRSTAGHILCQHRRYVRVRPPG
jgi:hypothetical protein